MRVFAIVVALVAGCSPVEPKCPEGPGHAAPTTSTSPRLAASTTSPATAATPFVDLEITVTPSPVPTPHVDVEVIAGSSPDVLSTWIFARAPQLSAGPTASDDMGAIPVALDGARLTLGRPARGLVKLQYTSKAEPPAYPASPAVAVDPDRFDAATAGLLAIPESMRDREIRVRLEIDLGKVSTAELSDGASSIGVGARRDAKVRGRDLQDAHVIGGLMGKARLEGPEGHDEAAWIGYTAFDPRPAIADLAGFRTAARQIFGDLAQQPLTVLVVTDARPTGAFAAARHGHSISLRVGIGEPWSAPVRIAMATEVLREWIGPRLWIGPLEAGREAEAYWFTEGVTRALARDLLFRFGLLTSEEVAAEMEGLAGLAATSPLRSSDNGALAKLPKGALPLLVARGALYATRVDATLRKKSKGAVTLPHVLRALYRQARDARGPLPTEAWLAAVAKEIDDAERRVFRDSIERGKPVEMPDDALGPCFRRVTKTYAAFDAGLDVEASRANERVTGLVAKGPADAAGLREGDALVELTVVVGRSDVPIEAVVDRAGDKKKIRYRPAGEKGRGSGWERKKEVPESACAR